jgi:hypothetical protein
VTIGNERQVKRLRTNHLVLIAAFRRWLSRKIGTGCSL